jgi:protein involved in sex pheromone biosynthesis
MPNKLQKERSKNTAMIIDERKRLLPSSKVLGDDCWQKNNFKGFKKRIKICPLSLLMIQG